MEKLATENLFLLEFLVDDVKMDSKCDCDTPPGELCVSFQFLDNDPLDVCEADFSPERKYGREENTKSGKSCLFSLTPEQVQKSTEDFDVMVNVNKKMQPGWLPEKITVGTALISIANLFAELIRSVEMQADQAPSAKTLKDTFKLLDTTQTQVGKISIYIRVSCFGKLIVTQFQMNLEDQSVLFKDKGGQSLYRYKKAKKETADDQLEQPPAYNDQGPPTYNDQCPTVPCYPEQIPPPNTPYNQSQIYPPPNPTCPMTPCFPGDQGNQDMGTYSQFQDMGMYPGTPQSMYPGLAQSMYPPFGQSMLPCSECNMMMMAPQGPQQPPCLPPYAEGSQMLTPCEECGTLLGPQFKAEVTASPSVPTEPSVPTDPPGNYQEIGATMGGNALTIRVHKDKNRIEPVDAQSVGEGSGGSCCCSPGSIGVKKPRKEIPCTARSAPPQSYDMRPGVQQGDQNLPFSFKMSGAGAPPSNNVIVNPPIGTKPDGTKFTEISDPNKEMFVLRIGKKSEGVQKKANLELELCTPRGPELKPIPKKETRDSQYDPADVKDEGKGKGKKGGKAKGKKGGKGKGKKGKKK